VFVTQFFVGLTAKLLKAIVVPAMFFWMGIGWLRRRIAERGIDRATSQNARREELAGLDDDDLDQRMRRSLE
jgi:hypothetical protein|tara:strand:+ start:65 stop:280 length:216 start_codon:yes stop_codon:yes gene_type:complete